MIAESRLSLGFPHMHTHVISQLIFLSIILYCTVLFEVQQDQHFHLKINSRAIARMSLWQLKLIVCCFVFFFKKGKKNGIVRLSQNGIFDKGDL